jgi:hypothetical protein
VASAASKQGVANAVFAAGWDCWSISWDSATSKYRYTFGTETNQTAITGTSNTFGGCVAAAVSRAKSNPRPV